MFKNESIKLIPEEVIENKCNYFTVLIGNNGTGKSMILSNIVQNINNFETISPSKVIAISNTISDKFPMDEMIRYNGDKSNKSYNQMNYVYLGLRSRNNFYSARTQFNKALDILVENYHNKNNSESFRHIFKYLDYEPIIKINYSLKIPRRMQLTENSFHEVFSNKHYINLNRILEQYNVKVKDLVNFIGEYLNDYPNNNNILFNFSEKNVERITNNNSLYNDEEKKYILLEILKKLKIVKKIEINLFKKDGTEINFREASSGEVAILSTLIALVPLIKDNCLILIDEPELSLHPYWQSQYIPLIKNILKSVNGCHIIIATHSSLLLSDLPLNESSVVMLERTGSKINTNILNKSTYGWATEDILLNVFSLATTRNYYLSQMVGDALILIKDNNYHTEEFEEIRNKLKNISIIKIR